MSDIFICYSRTDSAIAKQLTDRLEAEGWAVYIDVQNQVGRRWDQEIEYQLAAAKSVVALWSAQSRTSEYVLEEAEYGKRNNKLFPALIERVGYPYGFSRIQTADMIGWKGEPDHPGLAQLLAALRGHLGLGRQPFAANGAVDESQHGDADLRPDNVGTPSIIQTPPASSFIPGQIFRDQLKIGCEGPVMVVIPSGRFLMGSPPDEPERRENEGPQHEVIIKTPFALGVTAVTFADYGLFCQNTRRKLPLDCGWGRLNRPIINVTWHDAQDYCAWLIQQTGYGYRLPNEAEWEYACRAGTQTPFSFGSSITAEQVNYDGHYPYAGSKKGKSRKKTTPVQSFPPNTWGLYEMQGNVWEWVQDQWQGNYNGAPGYPWVARVLRGGSLTSFAGFCRSAFRFDYPPDSGDIDIGFRCARVLS